VNTRRRKSRIRPNDYLNIRPSSAYLPNYPTQKTYNPSTGVNVPSTKNRAQQLHAVPVIHRP